MARSDWVQLSAPRVELDQRSREARLRLEHAERLLVVRPLPRQSFLRRVLRRLGLRIYVGEHVAGKSGRAALTRGRPRQGRRMPSETGGVGGSCCSALLASWPEFPRRARMGSIRPDPAPSRDPAVQGKLAQRDRRAQCTQLGTLRDWQLAGRQSEMRNLRHSFTAWDHWCGREDLHSHVLTDNRF
jgi:hypothetical protein